MACLRTEENAPDVHTHGLWSWRTVYTNAVQARKVVRVLFHSLAAVVQGYGPFAPGYNAKDGSHV